MFFDMYILKVYSIHYTLRKNKSLKKSFWTKKTAQKSPLFSFASSNLSQFYFRFVILLSAEAQGSAL